jgi:hypothetical protein
MNFLKIAAATALGLTLMNAVFAPVAKADDWNRKTVMTFSAPVEIPGDVEIAAVVTAPPVAELRPDSAPAAENPLPATASSLPLAVPSPYGKCGSARPEGHGRPAPSAPQQP